jgi:hypothetical protein
MTFTNVFQECFQLLYSRWQKFIVAQGFYFEGNKAYIFVPFSISQRKDNSGNILLLPHMNSFCTLVDPEIFSHFGVDQG